MSDTIRPRPLPVFTYVPVRARRDGWTPLRQARFIFELTATGCVDEACRRVGLSQQSAYRLRDRADAVSFRAAWAQALDRPMPDPEITGRAIGGTATPIVYAGRRVGERRRHDNRLAMYILRRRRPPPDGALAARAHPSRRTGTLAARRAARDLAEREGANHVFSAGEPANGHLPLPATVKERT